MAGTTAENLGAARQIGGEAGTATRVVPEPGSAAEKAELPSGYERISGLYEFAHVLPTREGTRVIIGKNHPVIITDYTHPRDYFGADIFLRIEEVALPKKYFQSDEVIDERGIKLKHGQQVFIGLLDPTWSPVIRVSKGLGWVSISIPAEINPGQANSVSFSDLEGEIKFSLIGADDNRVSIQNESRSAEFAVPDWSQRVRVSREPELDEIYRRRELNRRNITAGRLSVAEGQTPGIAVLEETTGREPPSEIGSPSATAPQVEQAAIVREAEVPLASAEPAVVEAPVLVEPSESAAVTGRIERPPVVEPTPVSVVRFTPDESATKEQITEEKSWGRVALEMADDDYAAAGFEGTQNEIVAAAAPKPGSPEKAAELPAFLQKDESGEYILPDGYEGVELLAGGRQQLRLGLNPGDQVVCYLGNVGVILERGEGGGAYFRFAGIPLPEYLNVKEFLHDEIKSQKYIGPKGIQFGHVREKYIAVDVGKSTRGFEGTYMEETFGDYAYIFLPEIIKVGDAWVQITDLSFSGGAFNQPNFRDKGIFNIRNDSSISLLKIALPSAAVVREKATESDLVGSSEAEEWKSSLKMRGEELADALGEYMKESSLRNLVKLLGSFAGLGKDVYLARPEGLSEEEFEQQAGGFDEAAEVMMGYFQQIFQGSQGSQGSQVGNFRPLRERYSQKEWAGDLEKFFSSAGEVDKFIAGADKLTQGRLAVLGAAALTRMGQLAFSKVPEGAKVDIGELRKLYQEAIERYLSRLKGL